MHLRPLICARRGAARFVTRSARWGRPRRPPTGREALAGSGFRAHLKGALEVLLVSTDEACLEVVFPVVPRRPGGGGPARSARSATPPPGRAETRCNPFRRRLFTIRRRLLRPESRRRTEGGQNGARGRTEPGRRRGPPISPQSRWRPLHDNS